MGVFNSEYFNGDLPSSFVNETRDYDRIRKNYFINLGVEYYINDKTSLTISGFVRDSNNTSDSNTEIDDLNANGDVLSSLDTITRRGRRRQFKSVHCKFYKEV